MSTTLLLKLLCAGNAAQDITLFIFFFFFCYFRKFVCGCAKMSRCFWLFIRAYSYIHDDDDDAFKILTYKFCVEKYISDKFLKAPCFNSILRQIFVFIFIVICVHCLFFSNWVNFLIYLCKFFSAKL